MLTFENSNLQSSINILNNEKDKSTKDNSSEIKKKMMKLQN